MIASFEMEVTGLKLIRTSTLKDVDRTVVAELRGEGMTFDLHGAQDLKLGQRLSVSIETLPAAAKREILDSFK